MYKWKKQMLQFFAFNKTNPVFDILNPARFSIPFRKPKQKNRTRTSQSAGCTKETQSSNLFERRENLDVCQRIPPKCLPNQLPVKQKFLNL